MIKIGANSVLFAAFDLETAMRQIAQAGYDGMELSAIKGMCEHLDLDNYSGQIQTIRDLAHKYELELLARCGRPLVQFPFAIQRNLPRVN